MAKESKREPEREYELTLNKKKIKNEIVQGDRDKSIKILKNEIRGTRWGCAVAPGLGVPRCLPRQPWPRFAPLSLYYCYNITVFCVPFDITGNCRKLQANTPVPASVRLLLGDHPFVSVQTFLPRLIAFWGHLSILR